MTTTPHWIFDDSPIEDTFGDGERAVQWLRKLKHPKSSAPGKAFQLDTWQERIIRKLYGPRNPDGTRIVQTVFMLLPRGSRKTSLSAALAALHLFGTERVPGTLVQSAASSRKQSRECYEELALLVGQDARFAPHVRVQDYKNTIRNTLRRTRYEALSSDAGVIHGGTPTVVIADEVHAWKRRDLWEVLSSSLNKTKGSLMVVTTTAGRGQDNLAFEQYQYALKVQGGEVVDPSFLPVIFQMDEGDDWKDESVWHAVMPGLAKGYPDIEGLRRTARKAEHSPSDLSMFLQLHLNKWLDAAVSAFVDMATYDRGAEPIDLEKLAGEPCWLGVDLSSTTDLSVVVSAWRDGDGGYLVRPWFFCPGDNLLERQEASDAPYLAWAEAGLITPTPGNVVDFDFVEARIRDLCEQFDVQEIAFDPALARGVLNNLLNDGLPAIEHRQTAALMMPAIAETERAILAGRLQHGGHPVLRWTFANTEVVANSHGHKVRLHKGLKHKSIDGAVATAMAVNRAANGDSSRSIHETQPVAVIR